MWRHIKLKLTGSLLVKSVRKGSEFVNIFPPQGTLTDLMEDLRNVNWLHDSRIGFAPTLQCLIEDIFYAPAAGLLLTTVGTIPGFEPATDPG